MPTINEKLCNDCGLCVEQCPVRTERKNESKEIHQTFACQAKDQELLIEATAGGLFPVLARWILRKGGVVFGAAYDAKMTVVHRAITEIKDIKIFSGSKYVQSDPTQALLEAHEYLQRGRTVLFSGTPCQIEALNRLCQDIPTENLYTVDVVCYGIPSPKLFRAYLDTIEAREHAKVIDFRFRDKHRNGWSHTTVITLQNSDGGITKIEEPDYSKIAYYKMFGSRDCFRKSCYHCQFNSMSRISDLTTGNFWGIEKISQIFDSILGVSMAILNTQKGIQLFSAVQPDLIWEMRSGDEAICANDALTKGSTWPKRRNAIYHCFVKNGFLKTVDKFYTLNRRQLLRIWLSRKKQIFLAKLKGGGDSF